MDRYVLQNSSDLELSSSTLQGNYSYAPCVADNIFYQQHLVKPEDRDNCSLSQWFGYQHLAPNSVDYLLGNEICNMQGEIPYKSTGTGCGFTHEEYFANMLDQNPNGLQKTKRHAIFEPEKKTQSSGAVQHHHQPIMSASTLEMPTKSRRKASEVNRRRRTRVAAALDALEDLLPHSKEGNKTNVVDDCIDYIKHLQLYMRELSRNRLGGEPTSSHLLYLEGYGHYLVRENSDIGAHAHQDMLGKLFEANPTKLLESRDLFMMPYSPN